MVGERCAHTTRVHAHFVPCAAAAGSACSTLQRSTAARPPWCWCGCGTQTGWTLRTSCLRPAWGTSGPGLAPRAPATDCWAPPPTSCAWARSRTGSRCAAAAPRWWTGTVGKGRAGPHQWVHGPPGSPSLDSTSLSAWGTAGACGRGVKARANYAARLQPLLGSTALVEAGRALPQPGQQPRLGTWTSSWGTLLCPA